MPYGDGAYPLSLRDLSLAGHVTELIESGVSSLKIEGRMKNADYVYGVTRIYRRLLDERRNATAAEARTLAALFSRSGFTDGYFTGNLRDMTGVRSEEQKEESRALEKREFSPMRTEVSGEAEFCLGKPTRFTLTAAHKSVTVYGETPVQAISAPLTKEALSERLCKMGNTFLSLSPDALSIHLEEGVNLSPAAINALRRAAADAMEASGREAPPEIFPVPAPAASGEPLKTAVFYKPEVLSLLSEKEKSFFDIRFVPLACYENFFGERGVVIPPVIMERELPAVRERLAMAASQGATHALISNLSHFALCREARLIPVGDFRMNLYNCEASAVVRALGAERSLCSLELTVPRAASVGGVLVYGRAPLMLTERCFVKENAGFCACGAFSFTDRRGMQFPILREYPHRNLIFNSIPTYMGDKQDELKRYRILHHHFIFSVETAAEIQRVLAAYREGRPLEKSVRRIGVSEARIYDAEGEVSACKKSVHSSRRENSLGGGAAVRKHAWEKKSARTAANTKLKNGKKRK